MKTWELLYISNKGGGIFHHRLDMQYASYIDSIYAFISKVKFKESLVVIIRCQWWIDRFKKTTIYNVKYNTLNLVLEFWL